ncbi:MAG: hypothetical protein CG442_1237 [Methylococcaceae bacterium NSO1]|nr:MAG: hypothetical protein CG442_1237 [Methylococcaceae bacterium NSO1]
MLRQCLGGAASRKNFNTQLTQFPAKIDDTGFIGDADQGASNFFVHVDL